MTLHKNLLNNYQTFSKLRSIRGADKGMFDALWTGHFKLSTRVRKKPIDLQLKDTLYAPKITFTLISTGRCDDVGYRTEFSHQKCVIKSANGKTPKLHGLYHLDNELAKNKAYQSLTAFDVHKKLGHLSYKALRHLLATA